jgi:chemotaxis protein CheX
MDAHDIVPFVQSVQNLFKTMLNASVKVSSPRLRDPDQGCYDVSGIIGMSGDVEGAVVLSFRTETAMNLVERFCSARLETDDPDFADAVGELANVVAGGAKAKLTGRNISISCPSVVVGPDHRVFSQKAVPVIDIPIDSEFGPFAVFVSLRAVTADQPAAASA